MGGADTQGEVWTTYNVEYCGRKGAVWPNTLQDVSDAIDLLSELSK